MYMYVYMDICINTYMLPFQPDNRKQEPRRFSLIRLLIVQTEKFAVCPFVNEETNGSYPFASRLNELNRLAHLLWLPENGEHLGLALFIDDAHLAALKVFFFDSVPVRRFVVL